MSSKTHSSSHSNSNHFECFTRWKHCYAVALRSISPTTKTSNQFEFSCRCHFKFSFSSFSGANEEKNRRQVTSHNGEAQKLKSFFSALNWCKRWKETLFLLSRLVRCLHLHSLSNVILTYFSCCNFQCATHSCLICFTIYFQPKCYVLFRKWSFYHVFYHIKSTRNHNGKDRNRTSSHASKFFFLSLVFLLHRLDCRVSWLFGSPEPVEAFAYIFIWFSIRNDETIRLSQWISTTIIFMVPDTLGLTINRFQFVCFWNARPLKCDATFQSNVTSHFWLTIFNVFSLVACLSGNFLFRCEREEKPATKKSRRNHFFFCCCLCNIFLLTIS